MAYILHFIIIHFTLFATLSRCYKKLEKLLKLENSEWPVLQMGKSGPLERVRLANQIQGFGIPIDQIINFCIQTSLLPSTGNRA